MRMFLGVFNIYTGELKKANYCLYSGAVLIQSVEGLSGKKD